MLHFLPILLLVLHSLTLTAPVDAAPKAIVHSTTCCRECCQCSANTCYCSDNTEEEQAPTKVPFSFKTVDLAPQAASSKYQLPAITVSNESHASFTIIRVITSHHRRQALLGRWQN